MWERSIIRLKIFISISLMFIQIKGAISKNDVLKIISADLTGKSEYVKVQPRYFCL